MRAPQLQFAVSLGLPAGERRIGVRDPHGFRPLVIGKLKDS